MKFKRYALDAKQELEEIERELKKRNKKYK